MNASPSLPLKLKCHANIPLSVNRTSRLSFSYRIKTSQIVFWATLRLKKMLFLRALFTTCFSKPVSSNASALSGTLSTQEMPISQLMGPLHQRKPTNLNSSPQLTISSKRLTQNTTTWSWRGYSNENSSTSIWVTNKQCANWNSRLPNAMTSSIRTWWWVYHTIFSKLSRPN